MPNHLTVPHGGTLVDLICSEERAQELKAASAQWPSWDLSPRQLCDLELLVNGGFSPLGGFMTRRDYEAVCDTLHLPDGTLWPIPITLDVSEDVAHRAQEAGVLALRDPEGVMLAVLRIEDAWQPDLADEARRVYGTDSAEHPGVAHLRQHTRAFYLGGPVEGIQVPVHHDFRTLRLTPAEVRDELTRRGWRRTVAFQTSSIMHRAHVELTMRAAREVEASLLVHPVVGPTKSGDVDHYTRVRCYQAIMQRYARNTSMLSLLPLAMRMEGPREALWHAIISKNYGCSHFIVGPDHASSGTDHTGRPFGGPSQAQDLLREHADEVGVQLVAGQALSYVEELDSFMTPDEAPKDSRILSISGSELGERLANGRDLPEWFTYPEVAVELRRAHPPLARRGFTVFFTGLSGAGKSTIANALLVKLLELGGRPVTLLDGDIVRKNLSSELGFSKEHRDLNIRRIGFVASEITKNGGIAICAPIAPYDAVRKEVRASIEPLGGFVLTYMSTPLEVCEQRDRKGMYAKARAGIIRGFTGIDDAYEPPEDADLVIDTTEVSPDEAAQRLLLHLEKLGYVGPSGGA